MTRADAEQAWEAVAAALGFDPSLPLGGLDDALKTEVVTAEGHQWLVHAFHQAKHTTQRTGWLKADLMGTGWSAFWSGYHTPGQVQLVWRDPDEPQVAAPPPSRGWGWDDDDDAPIPF